MQCQTEKKKGGDWTEREREKASYPHANMQIRVLLGSLDVIEVRCLSLEAMENKTTPSVQVLMNGMNILKKNEEYPHENTCKENIYNLCVCVFVQR